MLPREMKAILFDAPGPPDVLRIASIPIPVPKEKEVLIQVAFAGVNRSDIAQRLGKYPPPPGATPILGLEVSGTIVAVGPNSKWNVGEKVCALVNGGGYAEYCLAPDAQCLPIPKGITLEEAAGIPETFFTVWANVFQLGGLKKGETFLVHGGASGIGTTAIQLAKAIGTRVFATAGSQEKCDACLKLGADFAINYKEKDFVEEVLQQTQHEGVNLILDIVGAPYTPRNLACLSQKGRLVQISVQKGSEAVINLSQIMQKRLTLTGSTLRPRSVEEKGEIAQALFQQVWPLLESKVVKVVIDSIFPLALAADAHKRLESSKHIGKIILKISA
jgi:NADPH2:quinone reductase